MDIKKWKAFFSLFMGIAMIGMWLMFYVTGQIPEIQTKPVELGMHVAAEIVTGLLLIIGGYGSLTQRSWGEDLYLLSMGMLLYTLIMSPGYFLQKGEVGFVAMFGAFIVLALYFVVSSVVHRETPLSKQP